ncbi:unnamed protein product [Acanthoscelides obtectus]|uniref:Homeobox protein cut-like n=1 Tax=Acanthoscelides obtectus TaxID=200917 RepID=A0A9P0K924_ACAOB|nr:unnamed protein product [Acanthoscelides obtectus]CAK1662291.1 Homeobox protein cut [Acanthoscelides obtectus]
MTRITQLEDQLEQKRQHIIRLESRLDQQKDYDDLKREVSILRDPEGKNIDALLEKSKNLPQDNREKSPTTDNEDIPPPSKCVTPTLVNTLVVSSASEVVPPPPPTDQSAASTPQPQDQPSPLPIIAPPTTELMVNGNSPISKEDNNNHHHSNNNIPLAAAATMCAVNNFLRSEDSLKSPYRFDDHRSPFKFAEELGMAPGSMVGRLGESLIPKGDPMEARLQEMLRYNMDKYASQNLDTLHISRRVRELLSIHNIGQRLFAKYILGLSQGTVSELLSKPKPWDKLTEKGRDSYRKMHAWACDENAILLLKSLIPKKDNFSSTGKSESGMPPFTGSDLTEERLAHILNEANQFQQIKQQPLQHEDSRSNEDSKSPHGCGSPFSRDSSLNKKLKKYENDDIPQEKVVRIYQEELAKLMSRRIEDMRNQREGAGPFPGIFLPHLFSAGGGQQMDRTQEDIRIALDAYHRELAKLNQGQNPTQMPLSLLAMQQQALAHHHQQQQQQQQQNNGGVQDLSIPKDKMKMMNGIMDDKEKDEDTMSRHSGSAFSLVRPKIEPGSQQAPSSTASSPLGNSILPPMTPTDDFSGSAAASPLQRMASITNSLISQPPSQPHHTSNNRPLKAVLPPITQQQFDIYNNLNTEDIVKKVKEQLSQYSISQRLFGESVLGLSQGSVSDLLARPKPWHMLTQKGREPFIRMKMFLEDEQAVHKLVASQYKIAPEKLMRTGGYGGSCAGMSKPMPPATSKMISEAAGLLNKIQHDAQQTILPPSLQLGPPPQAPGNPQPPPPPMMLTPPGLGGHHPMNLHTNSEMLKKASQSPHGIPHSPMSQQHAASLRNMHQHMSPSVYEMAALTQDLDTQVITTKIKEALLANNIGQKIFGEAVLGLSQGSVSELLSKPKPWHMLSIKGREPFIRMQLWLNDAHNVDRLQALKNERREANKRRRSSGPGAHDNSSDTSSNDTSEFYHSNSPGPGPPAGKKQRVLFSEEQKEALRLAFALDPYPNVATIEFLAGELGLSSRTITNWFHNHRMRLKQQVPHGMPPNPDLPSREQSGNTAGNGAGGTGQPFDPVQFRLLLNQRLLELSKERLGLAAAVPGVPLPYPPYLATAAAANTSNLAALISRGLLPTGADVDLSALNNAVKEQMSGLDLSMTSLKREPGDFDDDDDVESNVGSEDSNISNGSGSEVKPEPKEIPACNQARSSRRKPAAPQWVNPNWEEEKEKPAPAGDEVIINGVCVMQTAEDYARHNPEETVHVEPQAVMDRFEDDQSDTSSISNDQNEKSEDKCTEEPEEANEETEPKPEDTENKVIKQENEEERWEY